jgi:hypothetical protein
MSSTTTQGIGAKKEDLAKWVSKSSAVTLTPQNIRKRFPTTGICLSKEIYVMDGKMAPK